MSVPVLQRANDSQIVLAAPRSGAAGLTALWLIALLFARRYFPEHPIAQAMLVALVLWGVLHLLRVHDLLIDLEARSYRYRHGWAWSKPIQQGGFDDFLAVAIEANDAAPLGRVRSRLVLLEMRSLEPDAEPRVFALGFPMGPEIARETAAGFGRQLDTEVIDRTQTAHDEAEKDQHVE